MRKYLEARSTMSVKDPFQENGKRDENMRNETPFDADENAEVKKETVRAEMLRNNEETETENQPHKKAGRGEDERFNRLPSKGKTFSQRMSSAGYITGRQYDIIKNELLSYYSGLTGKGIRVKLSKRGELFLFGRKTLAFLRVSGTTLHLFLSLVPSEYSESRYHHKDMSGTARYARCPMMLRLTSDRQIRHAQELIGILMRKNGLEKNPHYVPRDQANVFGKPQHIRMHRGTAQKDAENARLVGRSFISGGAEVMAEIAAGEPLRPQEIPPEAIKAKLPRRATVFDRFGEKIGHLRHSEWFDEEHNVQGVFREQGEGVLYYPNGSVEALAYLDGNGNLLTANHQHVATLKRPLVLLIWILIAICVVFAILSVLFASFAVSKSEVPYVPTVFITDENKTHWNEQENLDVFYNKQFGDSVIAPGMRGAYYFLFENANKDAVEFSLDFSEKNEHGIGLVYRLIRDGAPVMRTEEFVSAEELGVEGLTLEAHSTARFELQWYWIHNDEADTAAGAAGAVYTLTIRLTASVVGR